jgi:hypothetical protein
MHLVVTGAEEKPCELQYVVMYSTAWVEAWVEPLMTPWLLPLAWIVLFPQSSAVSSLAPLS